MTDDPTPPTRRASEWRERGGRIIDPRTPDSPIPTERPGPPDDGRLAAIAAGVPMPPTGDDALGAMYEPAPSATPVPRDETGGLAELRLLSEAATGGEWLAEDRGTTDLHGFSCGTEIIRGDRSNYGWQPNDAAFAVAAVNYVRSLLAAPLSPPVPKPDDENGADDA